MQNTLAAYILITYNVLSTYRVKPFHILLELKLSEDIDLDSRVIARIARHIEPMDSTILFMFLGLDQRDIHNAEKQFELLCPITQRAHLINQWKNGRINKTATVQCVLGAMEECGTNKKELSKLKHDLLKVNQCLELYTCMAIPS